MYWTNSVGVILYWDASASHVVFVAGTERVQVGVCFLTHNTWLAVRVLVPSPAVECDSVSSLNNNNNNSGLYQGDLQVIPGFRDRMEA